MNSTLQTGLLVLERLLASGRPLGVCEIARDLDKGKSNVHRVLATLSSRGFVNQDCGTRKYHLSPRWAHPIGSHGGTETRPVRRAEGVWWAGI